MYLTGEMMAKNKAALVAVAYGEDTLSWIQMTCIFRLHSFGYLKVQECRIGGLRHPTIETL
jgi:hypothetical protein